MFGLGFFRSLLPLSVIAFALLLGGLTPSVLGQATKKAAPTARDQQTPKAGDKAEETLKNPFGRRIAIPDFPKDTVWLNVGGPLRKQDLKGKFVVLDFWTYCCINCLHILPELKKLERAYPNELVVIGVHSAKFETEKGTKNIEEAILRYEIEHPVINDAEHVIWDTFGVRSWPTVLMIDPEGQAVWGTNGEVQFEQLDSILKSAIPYYKQQGSLDETPIRFDLLSHRQKQTPLRFPGKVLADEEGGRLFITDSNHNRIVIASLDGKLLDTIGSGAIGRADGTFGKASFDHPQGVAIHGETLYVADTENHMLRKVDLAKKTVTTIAGTGKQRRGVWPGMEGIELVAQLPERFVGPPKTNALNSPWALWVHKDSLYIAMAGPHQIWKMSLDEKEIGPFAGNGREDIVDGPLLPGQPYEQGYSSFAQPSGLTSDGTWLYVADSEGSSIRAVPFDPKEAVRTIVGTSKLPGGRLFAFGDVDGDKPLATYALDDEGNVRRDPTGYPIIEGVRLQHALGVAYHDGRIYVTDTYNNKVKVVDAKTGATRTLAGTGQPGLADKPAQFDEPAGIAYAGGKLYVADTNNHLIRTIDLASRAVRNFEVAGLKAPSPPALAKKPNFEKATQVQVDPTKLKLIDGKITLRVSLQLPEGWKINKLAPCSYSLEAAGDSGPIDRKSLGLKKLDKPAGEFTVTIPANGIGKDVLKLGMNYYYCQSSGGGLCKVGSVQWTVPLEISAQGSAELSLNHETTVTTVGDIGLPLLTP
ncbi:MAG: hypothetical protein CMJ64_25890 [Planctomycetaceae bacterium]|nr:hypothetical protein [Planctomycetaceae bacterium]